MKLHHSLTDGVGGIDIARLLFDVEPDPADLGPMPDAPVGEHLGTVDRARDALTYDWSQLFSFAKRRRSRRCTCTVASLPRPPS